MVNTSFSSLKCLLNSNYFGTGRGSWPSAEYVAALLSSSILHLTYTFVCVCLLNNIVQNVHNKQFSSAIFTPVLFRLRFGNPLPVQKPDLVRITPVLDPAGPRSCIGKELGTDILFIIFTSLLQRFDFCKGCGCDFVQCFEGNFDFTYRPQPYKVKLRVHWRCDAGTAKSKPKISASRRQVRKTVIKSGLHSRFELKRFRHFCRSLIWCQSSVLLA